MIINDINYLEATNEEVFGGMVSVDKDVSIDYEANFDFEVDVNVDIVKDIDVTLDSTVNITGNFANLIFDVTAIGNNSLAEADVSATVTGGLAEVGGTLIAAVD